MKKKILIYFPAYNETIGGSENRFLSFVSYLQDRADVTVAMRIQPDFGFLEKLYGIHVDSAKVKTVLVKETGIRRVIAKILACEEEMALMRLSKDYDVCISCHGPKDFGKHAYHFIHMIYSFDLEYAAELGKFDIPRKFSKEWLVFYVRKFIRMYCPGIPRLGCQLIRDPHQVCIPNSFYVKNKLEHHYNCNLADVFYPPTVFKPIKVKSDRRLDVAFVGRMHPEKGIDDIIEIVRRAREITGKNIGLRLAGHLYDDDYGDHLRDLERRNSWLRLEGGVYGDAKAKLLAECSFAIHMLKEEAFGISVTEYLKSGLVPIVPCESAPAEIVDDVELTFKDIRSAVSVLTSLVTDASLMKVKQRRCLNRAEYFSVASYKSREANMINERFLSH